jgi:dienelactone hydrolase
MAFISKPHFSIFAAIVLAFAAHGETGRVLPGTRELTRQDDVSEAMRAGIERYLDAALTAAPGKRGEFWSVEVSSRETYEASVKGNRERLTKMLGAVEPRVAEVEMELSGTLAVPALVAETDRFTAWAVRWPVLDGVHGEGLLLRPKGEVRARVVAIPEADETPERIAGIGGGDAAKAWARRLVEQGCEVLIPTLVDRGCELSGNERIKIFTNQSHREWLHRQAYEMGRTLAGYETQKVLAGVDWFARQNVERRAPIGVAGWGEGGRIALFAAALDTRIEAALVSGYFGKREAMWQEPMDRNLFGYVREFGDAGLARLIVPRALIVEHAKSPEVSGPPAAAKGARLNAAPGRLTTPAFADVQSEVEQARQLVGPFREAIRFISGEASSVVAEPMSEAALLAFVQKLAPDVKTLRAADARSIADARKSFDATARRHRQVRELEQHIQALIEPARRVRQAALWDSAPVPEGSALKPMTPAAWDEAVRPLRRQLWDDVLGRLPASDTPVNAQSRLVFDEAKWRGYEMTFDVAPDVFAWGYLLLPKDVKPGERRPVIVTQHGGSGVPLDVIRKDNAAYQAFAVQLVERGFIVFAPHFPWRYGDRSRVLQRRANPLGLTVYSFILAQHERLLDWLCAQPFVDAERIGLYGLSWGGKVAMRAPAVLERYRLSICSGDFNEWIWKNVTTSWRGSFMFAPDYEMSEFNLGHTFGYAEMAALIAPRAFMVERGHDDGTATDEWLSYEYATVRRLYAKLGIPERTDIEYFNAGHVIHAAGTFRFIHRIFQWPEPKTAP